MQALDLTKQPPRAPHEELDGLIFMPRTIDKIRATLEGGNLGAYHVSVGMSKILLEAIHVSYDDLRAAVAEAESDADVAAWLRTHADTSKYADANAAMRSATLDDVSEDHRPRVLAMYPEDLRRNNRFNLDLLAADDALMFSADGH